MKTSVATFIAIGILSVFGAPSSIAEDETVSPAGICAFVAETAAAANAKISADMIDKDKGSPFVRENLVQNVVWNEGENPAPVITGSGHVVDSGQVDYYETHIRWSHDVGFLPHKGHWYKVFAETDSGAVRGAKSTGAYLSAVQDERGLVCAFDNKAAEHAQPVLGYYTSPKDDRLDCSAVVSPENVVLPETPLEEAAWINLRDQLADDHHPGWFAKNAHPWSPFLDGKTMPRTNGPILNVDINNDGQLETLISINYSTASNYACDVKYFDLVNGEVSKVLKSDLREALLKAQEISRDEDGSMRYTCGRSNEILVVDDRVAISSRQRLTRHVSVIRNDKPIKLCKSTFTIKPVIIFESAN